MSDCEGEGRRRERERERERERARERERERGNGIKEAIATCTRYTCKHTVPRSPVL